MIGNAFILFGVLVILGGLFYTAIALLRHTNDCPKCGNKTIEIGYDGFRACEHCGWRE